MASATSRGASYWLQQYTWPVIGVTAATVLSMGVYFKRHFANDPEVASPDRRGGGGQLLVIIFACFYRPDFY